MRPKLAGKAGILTMQLLLVAVGLLFWQWSADNLVDELLISRPTAVFQRVWTMTMSGALPAALLSTVWSVASGLFWGTLAGVAVGMLVALHKPTQAVLSPAIDVLFAIPKIALVPLFVLWFGISYAERSVFTAVVVFFFLFYATMNGVARVPPALNVAFELLGASHWQRVRLLYLPAALGWITGGLRIATPYAFVAVVSAEVIGSRSGLGALVHNSGVVLDTAGMFAGIVVTTLAAALSGGLVSYLDGRWRKRL